MHKGNVNWSSIVFNLYDFLWRAGIVHACDKSICIYKYTWSYKNRVSKHFVIFLNFPYPIACFMCCFLMWFFLSFFFFFFLLVACFVVRDLCRSECVDRITILPPPPSLFLSLPTILCLTQLTVIWNQCAPKAGFGAV